MSPNISTYDADRSGLPVLAVTLGGLVSILAALASVSGGPLFDAVAVGGAVLAAVLIGTGAIAMWMPLRSTRHFAALSAVGRVVGVSSSEGQGMPAGQRTASSTEPVAEILESLRELRASLQQLESFSASLAADEETPAQLRLNIADRYPGAGKSAWAAQLSLARLQFHDADRLSGHRSETIEYVTALREQAATLRQRNRAREALQMLELAAVIQRHLVDADPEAHLTDFVATQLDRVSLLGHIDRPADAAAVLEEVIADQDRLLHAAHPSDGLAEADSG